MSDKNKNSYSKTNNNNIRFKVDDIKNYINNKLDFNIDEDKSLNTEIEKIIWNKKIENNNSKVWIGENETVIIILFIVFFNAIKKVNPIISKNYI